MSRMALSFRPMTRDDLPLLHEWLERPHVQRWWNEQRTLEEVTAHYGPAIDGADPTDHYFAVDDGRPIGFFQTYLYWDYPEDATAAGIDVDAAGVDPTHHYFALDDGVPVGFFQTYLYWDYPEDATAAGIDRDAAGVDLFIADEERIGKGLGSDLLRRFTDDYAFALPGVTHCAAEPEEANVASIRAFEKAGFHIVRAFDDTRDGKRHVLVRKDRSRPEAASTPALERT
jgi:RimJ/RimL family protein N-acetyltransferase